MIKTFGELAREHREAQKMTVEELAVKCGCSAQTIHNLESGRTDATVSTRVAAILRIPHDKIQKTIVD